MNKRVFSGVSVNIFIAGLMTGILIASGFAAVFLLDEAYQQCVAKTVSVGVSLGITPGKIPEEWLTTLSPN